MDNCLLPFLKGALNPKEPYNLSDGFRESDLLHVLGAGLPWPAGTVLPVLGQCLCRDAQGCAWRLLAYVPAAPQDCTTYAGRQARRFPEQGQTERWFGGIPLGYFTELDLTDYADELALERLSGAVVIEMYPKQAQMLRQAA